MAKNNENTLCRKGSMSKVFRSASWKVQKSSSRHVNSMTKSFAKDPIYDTSVSIRWRGAFGRDPFMSQSEGLHSPGSKTRGDKGPLPIMWRRCFLPAQRKYVAITRHSAATRATNAAQGPVPPSEQSEFQSHPYDDASPYADVVFLWAPQRG